MANNTVNIGERGKLRINVDLVSQDSVKNTSKVRVKGYVWVTSGKSGDDTGNCKARFTGTNSTSNKTIKGNYTTTARLILDETFTVTHGSDGNKTVNYTFHFGPTITSGLGKGGTVSVSLKLPQLSTKPATPTNVAAVLSPPSSISVSYAAASSNSEILEYQILYSKNNTFTDSVSVSSGTALRRTFENLDVDSTYYFKVRARNSDGWGNWSDVANVKIPNVPDKMDKPSTVFKTPATIVVSFVPPPTDGGSPITGYELQYSTSSDFTIKTTKNIIETTLTLNNLSPDAYYFRVCAKNLIGEGLWSDSAIETIISGPKNNVVGTYQSTLVYVRHEGIYRSAIPYVRYNGDWRVAGG